jgi:CDP-glucose 4,6-dehydratase
LVAASYRKAFLNSDHSPLLATARAGNVIGGGDWSEDRLVPDLVRSLASKQSLEVRSPNATRPWQHVLESLSGYLCLGQKLIEGDRAFEGPWNFGPEKSGNQKVSEVLIKLNAHWTEVKWHISKEPQKHEANLLYLDSSKSNSQLGWIPVWDLDKTLLMTSDWYKAYLSNNSVITKLQLKEYVEEAIRAKVKWVSS